jgi:hypothetical protein
LRKSFRQACRRRCAQVAPAGRKVLALADIDRSATPSSSGALVARLQFAIKAPRAGNNRLRLDFAMMPISVPERWQACLADNEGDNRTMTADKMAST